VEGAGLADTDTEVLVDGQGPLLQVRGGGIVPGPGADTTQMALLSTGDLRDYTQDLAATTPAAELRDAYQAAGAMTAWADSACMAVEREIADGQPGDAITEWVTTAFGPARLIMAVALREQGAGPASTAATAVMLILIRNMLRDLRQLLPGGNFNVLRNPMVAPAFLADFLSR
jgi:hypothetical protein